MHKPAGKGDRNTDKEHKHLIWDTKDTEVAGRVTQRNTHQALTKNKTIRDTKTRQKIKKKITAVHQALFSSSKCKSLPLIPRTMKINLGYNMRYYHPNLQQKRRLVSTWFRVGFKIYWKDKYRNTRRHVTRCNDAWKLQFEQHLPWKPKILHFLDLIYTSLNEHKDTVTELSLIHWHAANAKPFLLLQNIRTALRQCLSRAEESCSSLLSLLDNETSVKMLCIL